MHSGALLDPVYSLRPVVYRLRFFLAGGSMHWEDFAWARRFLEAARDMFGLDPGDFPGPGNPVRSQAIKNERLALSCLAWTLVTVLS